VVIEKARSENEIKNSDDEQEKNRRKNGKINPVFPKGTIKNSKSLKKY